MWEDPHPHVREQVKEKTSQLNWLADSEQPGDPGWDSSPLQQGPAKLHSTCLRSANPRPHLLLHRQEIEAK